MFMSLWSGRGSRRRHDCHGIVEGEAGGTDVVTFMAVWEGGVVGKCFDLHGIVEVGGAQIC